MNKKNLFLLIVMGILVSSLSVGFNAYAEEKPIKIGLSADFTGALAEHGKQGKQGAILAMEQVNYMFGGRKLELIIEDNASDPAVGLDKARKLVETDKVSMMLGPVHGGVAGAVSGYAARVRVPLIPDWYSIGNAVMVKAKYSWAPFGTLSSLTYPTGAYAYEKLGYRTLTTIGTDYIAGREFIGGAVDAFEERGGKIIQQQWVPLGTKDFSPYITNLKKADAVLAWFIGLTVIPGLNQIKGYEVKMPIIMPQSGHSTSPKIMTELGDTVEGVITTCAYAWTIDTPDNKKFVEAYQKRWGELPGGVSYGGYSAVNIALAALERTGGDTSPDALAKALDATNLQGFLGPFKFGDKRVGIGNYVTYKHVREGNQILPQVLGYTTVGTKLDGNTLNHSIVDKTW